MSNKYSKTPVLATILDNPGEPKTVKLSKRLGQTIRALVETGAAGITALEMSTWALRLGAYIHILRHEYGLAILTVMEPHDGGKHGRYILQSYVTLQEPPKSV